ncbi:MAG: UDP-N-acetylglucosamine 1-carboxyvinyltransferase [bacterium]
MEKIEICGGQKLKGSVEISGSKNSALPIMAATLLTSGTSILDNIPWLKDIEIMKNIIESLGCSVEKKNHKLKINTSNLQKYVVPYELVKMMRASFVLLAPILVKLGKVEISLPGGCAIGTRPVDIHLSGLEKLGAKIELKKGYIAVSGKLKGAEITLSYPSVGATENLIMAASLADGKTIIKNAAQEPEIIDLANFLKKMGAIIHNAGQKTIEIEGIKELKPVKHTIIPDRIEAATFIFACVITQGEIEIINCNFNHLKEVIYSLEKRGVHFSCTDETIKVNGKNELNPLVIETTPYPGFPTDLQSPISAVLSIGHGKSKIKDTVFPNRIGHISELSRMGANIKIENTEIIIEGVPKLKGTEVMASDLRAGASLIIAALAAQEKTVISRVYHIRRGYENIEKKLKKLGAQIKKIE